MKTSDEVQRACNDEISRLNVRLEIIKAKRNLISALERAVDNFELSYPVYVKTSGEEYIPTTTAQVEIRRIMLSDIREQIANRIFEVEALIPGSTGLGEDRPEGRVLEL